MRKYGKNQDKYLLSVYLNEAQNRFVNECVDKYGMNKSQVAIRLMFAMNSSTGICQDLLAVI